MRHNLWRFLWQITRWHAVSLCFTQQPLHSWPTLTHTTTTATMPDYNSIQKIKLSVYDGHGELAPGLCIDSTWNQLRRSIITTAHIEINQFQVFAPRHPLGNDITTTPSNAKCRLVESSEKFQIQSNRASGRQLNKHHPSRTIRRWPWTEIRRFKCRPTDVTLETSRFKIHCPFHSVVGWCETRPADGASVKCQSRNRKEIHAPLVVK